MFSSCRGFAGPWSPVLDDFSCSIIYLPLFHRKWADSWLAKFSRVFPSLSVRVHVCVCECIHMCASECLGRRVASGVFFSPFPLRQGLSHNLQLPKGGCQWALRTSCLPVCRAEITSVRHCKQLLYNQTLLGLELVSSCLHSSHIPTWVFLSPNSAFRLPCF